MDKPPDSALQARTAVAFFDAAKRVVIEANQVGVRLSMADAQHLVRVAVTTYLVHLAEGGR